MTQRLSLAESASMMLASQIDLEEIAKFYKCWENAATCAFGGRLTLNYSLELKLLSTILYYMSSLCWNATPTTAGLSYCDVGLFQQGSKNRIFQMQNGTKYGLAVLFALLQYGQGRLQSISLALREIFQTLTIPEINNVNSVPEAFWSPLQYCVEVLLSPNVGANLDNLVAIGSEIHLFLFFLNSRHFLLETRLTGVLSTQNKPKSHGKRERMQRVLAWLMGFRLFILSIDFCKRILRAHKHHRRLHLIQAAVTQGQLQEQVTQTQEHSHGLQSARGQQTQSNQDRDVHTSRRGGDTGPTTGVTCPLCMDPPCAPACLPCGHLYCWRCILKHCHTAATTGPVTGGDRALVQMSCPVCRAGFQRSQIRALYGL